MLVYRLQAPLANRGRRCCALCAVHQASTANSSVVEYQMAVFDPMTLLQIAITMGFIFGPVILWLIENRRRT